jgi:small subunit ribosomal protein S5
MAGLQSLRTPEEVAELRGLSINQVLGLTTEETDGAAALNGTGHAAADEPAVAVPVAAGAAPADAAEEAEAKADADAEVGA